MSFKDNKEKINNSYKAPTEADKNHRLGALLVKFNENHIGKQIIDWANKHGVEIIFDDQAEANYFNTENNMVVLAWNTPIDSLVMTLAHELRHAWQHSLVDLNKYDSTPYAAITFLLLIEADAWSFGNMIHAIFKIPEENQQYIASNKDAFIKFRRESFDDFFVKDEIRIGPNREWIRDRYCNIYEQNPSYDFNCLTKEKEIRDYTKNLDLNKSENIETLKQLTGADDELIKTYIASYNYYKKWESEYCNLEEKDLLILGETSGLFKCWEGSNYFTDLMFEDSTPIMGAHYTDNITESLRNLVDIWLKDLDLKNPKHIIREYVAKLSSKKQMGRKP